MAAPLNLNDALRDYFINDELTKPIYGELRGKRVEDLTLKHKKWHRFVHLVKYALHWPGYRNKFRNAVHNLTANKPEQSPDSRRSGKASSSETPVVKTPSVKASPKNISRAASVALSSSASESIEEEPTLAIDNVEPSKLTIEQLIACENLLQERIELEEKLKTIKPMYWSANLLERKIEVVPSNVVQVKADMEGAISGFNAFKLTIAGRFVNRENDLKRIAEDLQVIAEFETCNNQLPEEYRGLSSLEVRDRIEEAKQGIERGDALPQEPERVVEEEPAEQRKEEASESSSESSFEGPVAIPSSTSSVAELEEVAPLASVVPDVALNVHTEAFLNLIKEHLDEQSAMLWRTLFQTFANHYERDVCKGISTSKRGEVTLEFLHPLQLHTISTNEHGEEDPVGGVVLIFASKGSKMELKVQFSERNMIFIHGYETTSKFPAALRNFLKGKPIINKLAEKIVKGEVFSFAKTEDKFTSTAKGPAGTKFPREKSYEEIVKGWSENATVLNNEVDPEEYIKSKTAS